MWCFRYPRRVRCRAGCIMIAATLRQTAAAATNVKSDIHMARESLVLFHLTWIAYRARRQRRPEATGSGNFAEEL